MKIFQKNRSNEKPVVLVTSVGAPPGLNTLRALAEAGHCDLIAADADFRSSGLYQFPSQHTILPWASDTRAYLDALLHLVRKSTVLVILPCLEEEVLVLAQHRAELEAAGAKLLLPNAKVVAAVTDKGVCNRIAMKHGIDCPISLVLPTNQTFGERRAVLEDFLKNCPLPWIVKPVWGHGMRGVTHADSFEDALSAVCTSPEELLVQEFIPGSVGSMYLAGLLYDREGHLVRRFSSRSICTLYESGGPATAGVSVECPEIVEATERLVALIGAWQGPLNAEWMLDPRDGKLKFIEINPRMWGYGYLATGSGLNFPDAIVSLALGDDIGSDPGFREGVTLVRSTIDLIFTASPFDT